MSSAVCSASTTGAIFMASGRVPKTVSIFFICLVFVFVFLFLMPTVNVSVFWFPVTPALFQVGWVNGFSFGHLYILCWWAEKRYPPYKAAYPYR